MQVLKSASKMGKSKRSGASIVCGGGGAAAAFVLLVVIALAARQRPAALARYLPTRADNSQLEALKELIITLLNEASETRASQMERQTRSLAGPNRVRRLYASSQKPRQLFEDVDLVEGGGASELALEPMASQSRAATAYTQRLAPHNFNELDKEKLDR